MVVVGDNRIFGAFAYQLNVLDPRGNYPVSYTHLDVYKRQVLDGTNTDGSQAIEYKKEGGFGDLTINGCEIRN